MSYVTHINPATGEFLSHCSVTHRFEYENEAGIMVPVSAGCWLEMHHSDGFDVFDSVRYQVALADALNHSDLDFESRQQFHQLLLAESAA